MKKLLLGLGLLAANGAPALADGATPSWSPDFAPPAYYHPPGSALRPFLQAPMPGGQIFTAPKAPNWHYTPPRPAEHAAIPMRVIIVRSDAGDCGDHCASWISAEGEIVPGTATLFRQALASMGERKLPVLISSQGGNVQASLEIGRMIRARGLDVVVSKTKLTPCPDNDKTCGDGEVVGRIGTPRSLMSYCESACVNILAAGTRRFVSTRLPLVGVHEMEATRFRQKAETFPTFNTLGQFTGYRTKTVYDGFSWKEPADPGEYRVLASYFKEMGIKADMIALMHLATPDQMHWMSPPELSVTGLVTEQIASEDYIAALDSAGSSAAPKQTPPAVACSAVPKSLPVSATEVQARVDSPASSSDASSLLAKEENIVGWPLNPQIRGYGVTMVTTLSGTPPQTLLAVVPPAVSAHVGDTVVVLTRHKDSDPACSFTPNLILSAQHP